MLAVITAVIAAVMAVVVGTALQFDQKFNYSTSIGP